MKHQKTVTVTGPDDPLFQSTIYCTGSYDTIGILYCRTNVGSVFGFVWMRLLDVGQATIKGILASPCTCAEAL